MKKGPRARQAAQNSHTTLKPKDWLAQIQKAMSRLAKDFNEDTYQSQLEFFRRSLPSQHTSVSFNQTLISRIRQLSTTRSYNKDSLPDAKVNYYQWVFSNILTHRMICDLNENTLPFKNQYLYMLWDYISKNLLCFTEFLINKDTPQEFLIPALGLYESSYTILERYIDRLTSYLDDIRTAPAASSIAKMTFEDTVRDQLLSSYKTLFDNQIEACFIWGPNDYERIQRSYNNAQKYFKYMKDNASSIATAASISPHLLTMLLQPIETKLSDIEKKLSEIKTLILMQSPFVSESIDPTTNDTLRDSIIRTFKTILAESIDTNAALNSRQLDRMDSTVPDLTVAPLDKRLKDLTNQIKEHLRERNFKQRLDNLPTSFILDTQTLLLELRNNFDKESHKLNFREAMSLMILWRQFFTTEPENEIPGLIQDVIGPTISALTITLQHLNTKILSTPSDTSLGSVLDNIVNEIIEAAINTTASLNIEDYNFLTSKYSFHFNNEPFILILLNKIDKLPLLAGKLEMNITCFDKMDQSIQTFQKRINILQFVLIVFSSYTKSDYLLETLHKLWMNLNCLFSNTTASFGSNIVPSEHIKPYYQRIDRAYELIKFYSSRYQSLIRSIDQRRKLSLYLKALLKRELFLAESSFGNIHGSYAYLSLKQFDFENAIEAIETAYQYFSLLETKLKLGYHKKRREVIELIRGELSNIAMRIYSPVFSSDPERVIFMSFTLDTYRKAYKTDRDRTAFTSVVFNYLDNLSTYSLLQFSDSYTQERFLIATGHLFHFLNEINIGSTQSIAQYLSIWLHLNKCYELIENMPRLSDAKLIHAKEYKSLLDKIGLAIHPIAKAALENDTSVYSQAILNEIYPALWQFYYCLTLRQLQYCQLYKGEKLGTLSHYIQFFKDNLDAIIHKSESNRAECQELANTLFINEAALQAELTKEIRPPVLQAIKSTPENIRRHKVKGKKRFVQPKPKPLTPPLLSTPVEVETPLVSEKFPPLALPPIDMSDVPWKIVSRRKRKKQVINVEPLLPSTSSSTNTSPSASEILTTTYQPLSDDEITPANVIDDAQSTPPTSVDQLTKDIDALSLNSPVFSEAPLHIATLPIRLLLSPALNEIYNRIRSHGYTVYIVGGYIRDSILGVIPNDVDFLTNCPRYEIARIFNYTGFEDENRLDLYRLNSNIDIVSVQSLDLHDNATKRDITINAFYLGDHGVIYDPLNVGQTLHSPFLHLIGNDFNQRLARDPSLILRLIRFSNATGKAIAPELLNAMKANSPAIATLPWGILKSNIRALFCRGQHQALLNLIFLTEHQIIGHFFSTDPNEKNYYVKDNSLTEPYLYWKRALATIYSSGIPSVEEILYFLLSLRFVEFIQKNKQADYQIVLEQTAALIYPHLKQKGGEGSPQDYSKKRISDHYLVYYLPHNNLARRKPKQTTFLPMFHAQTARTPVTRSLPCSSSQSFNKITLN